MKRITNILLLTATLLMTGCGGHSPIDPDPVRPGLYPIQFGISADLEVESKAVIDDDNVIDFGFIVLGNLIVDTYSEIQPNIFGVDGTEVKNISGLWTYSPLRYWQQGTYNFAGIIPSSLFNATYDHATNSNPGRHIANLSETIDGSMLTIDFARDGFNLAETQEDLMVSFHSDVSMVLGTNEQANKVDLSFNHQLSKINILIADAEGNHDIIVDKVRIHGNQTVASGVTVTNSSSPNWTFNADLTSTSHQPYKTFTITEDSGSTANTDWILTNNTAGSELVYDQIISNLLVFPESCALTIEVEYSGKFNGLSKSSFTRTGTKSVNWIAGANYVYKLKIYSDYIDISASVHDWNSPDFNIDHTFE